MIIIIILFIIFIIGITLSFISDETLSKLMKESIWIEKQTGDKVIVLSMTSQNTQYTYIDENNDFIGSLGNVDTLWFLDNFKLSK